MKHQPVNGFPRKTAWTAIWFVLLGGATLSIDKIRDADAQTEGVEEVEGDSKLVYAGPLPRVNTTPSEILGTNLDIDEQEAPTPGSGATGHAVRAPKEPHQSIFDPGGRAMAGFYKALEGLERSGVRTTVRIMHYGDSILTTDRLSGQVRKMLQRRFGDAGHGFILMGKPWRWYNHIGARSGAYGEWRVRPVTSDPVADGIYGLGGVAFETSSRNAVAWVGTPKQGEQGKRVASFDLSYLERPRGGSFELYVNGELTRVISTSGPEKAVVHRKIEVEPGRAVLKLKTKGDGPVRVFGAIMESDRKGVIYDTLAINGARVSVMNRIDKEHWKSEIQKRKVDLVLLMFGANEGHNERLALKEYRLQLAEVLRTIRDGSPSTSCMVVGPLDQAKKRDDGTFGSRRMPGKLSDAQREVAVEEGCAFFDTYNAMGGENSMAQWLRKGWGGGDLVHPTEEGARQIGAWIAGAILAGYQSFLYCGERCGSNAISL